MKRHTSFFRIVLFQQIIAELACKTIDDFGMTPQFEVDIRVFIGNGIRRLCPDFVVLTIPTVKVVPGNRIRKYPSDTVNAELRTGFVNDFSMQRPPVKQFRDTLVQELLTADVLTIGFALLFDLVPIRCNGKGIRIKRDHASRSALDRRIDR